MTMICLAYDAEAHAVTYAGAGHCPMLRLQAASGDCQDLPSQGMPLGVSRQATYRDGQLELDLNDKLLLYTDGITEVAGVDRQDIFGPTRLARVFQDCCEQGGRDTLDAVFRAARTHSADGTFADDVTLVLLERTNH
jgi:sigma-B regulation protein RsbU (phosphoserine phosphatase)